MKLTIRKANIDDAVFIAASILDALGIVKVPDTFLNKVINVCQREDTLYSWQNTLVAELDGVLAGSLTAYDGNLYKQMRLVTFGLIMQQGGQNFSSMDMETQPGEYYLDSLSVRLPYRCKGVGTALLRACLSEAAEKGHHCVGLACELNNLKAKRLYESMGFKVSSKMNIFSEDYFKMTMCL